MKSTITLSDYKRAKLGWINLAKLSKHIGESGLDLELLYLYRSGELIILDERLIEMLDILKIEYQLMEPSNSVKFIGNM